MADMLRRVPLLSRLMGMTGKFRAFARQTSVWDTCLYSLSRCLEALFGSRVRIVKYYFMSQPVGSPARADPRGRVYAFSWAQPGNPLLPQIGRPPAVIADRFSQGAHCLIACVDRQRLAGCLWFVIGAYEEDEVRARFVPLPQGQTAWDFDVTVLPDYRMSRLFSYLWREAGAELAARGVERTVSRISAFNPGSLASHRRLGACKVGQALFVCIGRWQFTRSSPAGRWHVSRSHETRPVLMVDSRNV